MDKKKRIGLIIFLSFHVNSIIPNCSTECATVAEEISNNAADLGVFSPFGFFECLERRFDATLCVSLQ